MKKRRRFTEASLSRLKLSAPTVVVAPTLQKLLTGDKVRAADWARFVKAIQVFQEIKRPLPDFLGGVTLSPEVAAKLSAVLALGLDWSEEKNAPQRQDAHARYAEWQALADEVWRDNPGLSESAVAKMIVPRVSMMVINKKRRRPSWRTISRKITKPPQS